MTLTESLIAFTFAATILTLTPGLDTALILRTATVEGSKKAFHAAFGIQVGCLIWGAMVAFGLGTLIAASELAYNILKWCGAAYLCWLGLQMLLKPRNELVMATSQDAPKHQNWFLRGMLGNVLNPKIGVFYVSFLPQFIPAGHSVVLWTYLLVLIHVVIGTLWSSTLIAATRPLSRFLRRGSVVKWMDRTTGVLFLAFAARLALSRR
ncbi:LysE family translocator [Pectobacterium aroidearum]|uniref:LysE family translocator n=1 Tax=Pectobacterium aroidearum TaxID=1201031 RepID=UPI002115314E|nr:LysE family translocator [Pectobacterium aroidearum]UUE57617.1 LysE family translocator [Pectobacterium aroidearum]UUE70322.1 LysE family translocator [Pectobacterium aroidearum]UUE74700.1 LysE family translocator [Pectobacterium aroidearum]UUE79030.1 LysE family translocator [Pectobacterium aroidearum]